MLLHGMRLFALSLACVALAAVGCSAPSSDDEPPAEQEEGTTNDELQVAAATAHCEGDGVSFTLTRTRDNWPSRTRPVFYRLSDMVIAGVATPGSWSEDSTPLGANFRAEGWNGIPLNGSRFLTDSRMHAEKPRGPDNRGQGWGGAPLAFNARVRCVANLGPAASFQDRFRLAYEFTTDVLPGRRDPNLQQLATVPPGTLPPNLVAAAQDTQHFKAFELEGKRVYSITRRYTVFYDALGAPFAKGEWRTQEIPEGTSLSPAEWDGLPRSTWRWGLDD